ncbi:OmpH family outer membrane protein [Luteibaculum oceani]|uniref:OmpH family outer membrane protein n=1 Tax=Luteibaculum oceani TaxID=1294296 RepID=A0A5C6UZT1_9FLAO|nr:OmpH family outer membrane protein [Luteibaculum oceani]TXC78902.1 OmpH family outer membrane protein [Luteibaculum oceani]
MKKLLLLLAFIGGFSAVNAQKFAYVDSDYIMKQIPEFQEAQKELDNLSTTWQKEIEKRYQEIEEMYKSYQAEAVLLTEKMKQQREEAIIKKEQEVQEFQKSKFGVEGELFKKRQELVQPIQDKVYDALKEVSTSSGYDFIFDKSQSGILFADDKYDKSDLVLRKLGVKIGIN